jgi:phosphatidylinositol alpha-1,6-mannosyltransferase
MSARVLIVGMGVPGGIGRVEQTLSEAVIAYGAERPVEFTALWRDRHPDYLRDGAIDRLPTTVTAPIPGGKGGFLRELGRALRSFRPDFVLYTHVNLARPAPWLRAVGHPPYGVWVYGIEIWERLSFAHRLALARADVVLAISRYSVERAVEEQKVPRRLLQTIPLTLPEAMFAERREPAAREPGRLLTVARLDRGERRKGVEDVIRALPELGRRDVAAMLAIVGDGEDRHRLEQVARSLGLARQVEFRGIVSDAELRREYDRADLFVLPSDKEGFGLVFLEAMLSGTPVVGMATGGCLDLVRDGIDGRLISRRDELTSTLEELLADRPRLEAMRCRAVERARLDFSPERFRSELLRTLAIPDA